MTTPEKYHWYEQVGGIEQYVEENAGAGAVPDFTGAGGPEGVQEASAGQTYQDSTNGGLWIKITASGAAGWVMLGGAPDLTATDIAGVGAFVQGGVGMMLLYAPAGQPMTMVRIGDMVTLSAFPTAGISWVVDSNGVRIRLEPGNNHGIVINSDQTVDMDSDVIYTALHGPVIRDLGDSSTRRIICTNGVLSTEAY